MRVLTQRRLHNLPPLHLGLVLRLLLQVLVTRMEDFYRPLAEAMPAKLVLTGRRAFHVVASLALLDRPLALRTSLGVDEYPVHILRLILVLQRPLRHRVAVDGTVSFLVTIPTETIRTTAKNVETFRKTTNRIQKIHNIITAWRRTPLDLPPPVSIFHVGPQQVPRVLHLISMIRSQFSDHVLADGGGARRSGTLQQQATRTVVVYRFRNVISPARSAKRMATGSRDHIATGLEANSAGDRMIGGELSDRSRKKADSSPDSVLVVEPVVEELAEVPVEVAEEDDRGGSRLRKRRRDSENIVLLPLPYLCFVEDRVARWTWLAGFVFHDRNGNES